jgi:hypothetical protein
VGDRIRLGDAVARAEIPGLFATHDALVNNMRAGAVDKVVYEAGVSCLPVLASNPVFDGLLDEEQRFERGDVDALAERIADLASLTAAQRAEVGSRLRDRVRAGHSVETWAQGVVEAAGLA